MFWILRTYYVFGASVALVVVDWLTGVVSVVLALLTAAAVTLVVAASVGTEAELDSVALLETDGAGVVQLLGDVESR
jgi:hypothetical protein